MARRTTTGSRVSNRSRSRKSVRVVARKSRKPVARAARPTARTKFARLKSAPAKSPRTKLAVRKPVAAKAAGAGSRQPKLTLVPATPAAANKARPAARPAPLALVRPARAREPNQTPVGPDGRVARNDLLSRYTPLIKYVVERLAVGLPKSVDHEDLMSAGVLGLLDAYEKFDPGKGTKFETYAVWRIKGAVLDQLRSLDWASRSVRRKAREVEASTRRLDQRLGRAATEEEVAREAKMPLADYHRLMDQVRGAVLLSLDEVRAPEDGDSLGLADLIEDPTAPDVLARLEEEETRQILLETLNRLPEQERLVVALYYYEHMTLREIGLTLGISESRVSQVHSRAVQRLRSRVRRALLCA